MLKCKGFRELLSRAQCTFVVGGVGVGKTGKKVDSRLVQCVRLFVECIIKIAEGLKNSSACGVRGLKRKGYAQVRVGA